MKTLIAISLLIASAVSTQALTIRDDDGGPVIPYQNRYKAIARRGERVVIDGPCRSACTLVFQYVPANRICVTPRASLGIHRFWWEFPNGRVVDDQRATLSAIRGYPKPVQAWIAARGGYGAMPANSYWYIRGAETGVKPCL